MKDPKILHITNWYPTLGGDKRAMWIRRQIAALSEHMEGRALHINVQPGRKFKRRKPLDPQVLSYSFLVPIRSWFLIEWMTTLLLLYALLFKVRLRDHSLLNFHIAYPLCTYLHLFQRFLGMPVVVTEHWSAYHFDFNIKRPQKLKRIRRIFLNEELSFITVSRALKKDIERFADTPIEASIVPNVVDPPKQKEERTYEGHPSYGKEEGVHTYFMLGYWKYPKRPILAIEAFCRAFQGREDLCLKIGGYGPLTGDIENMLSDHEEQPQVRFLGQLERGAVHAEMVSADAFVHPSDYETFSVVCAEALIHGTPLLASDKGGVRELLAGDHGILIPENEMEDWVQGFRKFEKEFIQKGYDKSSIKKCYGERFSSETVGRNYAQVLREKIEAHCGG